LFKDLITPQSLKIRWNSCRKSHERSTMKIQMENYV